MTARCSTGGESDNLEPPISSGGDRLHSVVKAAAGSVPFVGSALPELLVNLVKPPYERRRLQWMEDVAEKLRELDERGKVSFSDLQEDESFITTIAEATEAAIRTHVEDKRTALRNAVLNAALPGAPEDSLRAMFIHWVDQFSEWHLRLLRLFQKPPPLENIVSGSLSMVVDKSLPELGKRVGFCDLLWLELHAHRLVKTNSLHGMMGGAGLAEKCTTDLGDRFLSFIEEPSDQATGGG